jgi:predicted transcriptional regulator
MYQGVGDLQTFFEPTLKKCPLICVGKIKNKGRNNINNHFPHLGKKVKKEVKMSTVHHAKNIDQPLFDLVLQGINMGRPVIEIAREFGIGETTIRNIRRVGTWRGYLAALRARRVARRAKERVQGSKQSASPQQVDERTGLTLKLKRELELDTLRTKVKAQKEVLSKMRGRLAGIDKNLSDIKEAQRYLKERLVTETDGLRRIVFVMSMCISVIAISMLLSVIL